MKFRLPISLYSFINVSSRNALLLILPEKTSQFLYKASFLWNTAYKRILTRDHDTSTKLSYVKSTLKTLLLENQKKVDSDEWIMDNFSI